MADGRENGFGALTDSVVLEPPKAEASAGPGLGWFINIASSADEMIGWGQRVAERDTQLRQFWPTEPILASALYSTAGRYAAFGWTVEGPKRTVRIVQDILHNSEHGDGWIALNIKVLTDLFSQDNGAFIEVVRAEDSPYAPGVQLNHLDAGRCVRTGRHEAPVIYYDRENKGHLLKWYQVIALTEFPSPVERLRGIQYCTVTRVLRAAQILRDISIYHREKVSGRNPRSVYFVGGINQRTITEALKLHQIEADNIGLTRYMNPSIIGSVDPQANVKVEHIDFASLPDGFDFEQHMRWYMNQLALGFGVDFQDLAPLPGGNLGTAQQSETLHMKARGKGPRLYMNTVEHALNFRGILPGTVHFAYGDQDVAEDTAKAALRLVRAQERAARITSGEISVDIARQLAVDVGDLAEEYADSLGRTDPQPHVVVQATGPIAGSEKPGNIVADSNRDLDNNQGRMGAGRA